jgi:hypothetical protein
MLPFRGVNKLCVCTLFVILSNYICSVLYLFCLINWRQVPIIGNIQYGNIKSNKTDFDPVGLPDKEIGGSLGDEANDSMNDVIQPPHLLRPNPTRYVSYLCKFVYCMAAVNAAPYDPQRLTLHNTWMEIACSPWAYQDIYSFLNNGGHCVWFFFGRPVWDRSILHCFGRQRRRSMIVMVSWILRPVIIATATM